MEGVNRRAPFIPEEPERTEWDVVVIGTGMGGSTLGYALARRGQRVLFIEKGRLRGPTDGPRPQAERIGDAIDESPGARLERGQWPLKLEGTNSLGAMKFFAPLGCGAGGSTALFAAALERFLPMDFRPRANFPHVTDASLPEAWPISYDDIAPYYAEAEKLFRVCGTPDPLSDDEPCDLREPPPLSARDQHFTDSWTRMGLHPYRIHVGCEFVPGCEQCLGVACPRDCKNDARRICLMPALERFGAQILPECEVSRLEAGRDRIERVQCRWNGREIAISGKVVVLAAGAWMTPVLLLRSRSESWPDGVANRSGLVGRNLMFHAGDHMAVFPRKRASGVGPSKAVALNDFYFHEGCKLGTFQSMSGSELVWGTVLWYLRSMVDKDPRWSRKLVRPFLPGVALLATPYFKSAAIFATIVEDLPYHHNRVLPDASAESGMRFTYKFTEELRGRINRFRSLLAETLAPHRIAVLPGEDNSNYGHVCGTCRFGTDPADSVLDRNNRAHDLTNLYVVDASFFPSSGGTNPALTIAANALRVADAIGSPAVSPRAERQALS